MNLVKPVWYTPNGESLIAYMARVSNPDNQEQPNAVRLIRYLLRHKHWSPFEMVSACFEINTTRDISRQLLRHRSFSFQEFSQRYADVSALGEPMYREARKQDPVNRQNSTEIDSNHWLARRFEESQKYVWQMAKKEYDFLLKEGLAKEQARALLPEGLTPTRMYMSGTLRSWLHFIDVRAGNGTQSECQDVAEEVAQYLSLEFPEVMQAFYDNKYGAI